MPHSHPLSGPLCNRPAPLPAPEVSPEISPHNSSLSGNTFPKHSLASRGSGSISQVIRPSPKADPTFESPHRHLLSHQDLHTSQISLPQHDPTSVCSSEWRQRNLVSHTSRQPGAQAAPCIVGVSLLLRADGGSSIHVEATSGRGHTAEKGEADSKRANCMLNVQISEQSRSPAQAAGAYGRRGLGPPPR